MKKKLTYTAVVGFSADGLIADHTEHFSHWSSAADQAYLMQKIKWSDCLIVGRVTYERIKERFQDNLIVVFSRHRNQIKDQGNVYWLNPQRAKLDRFLENLGVKRPLILGGRLTYSFFFAKRLIRDLYITIEPVLFGTGLQFLKQTLVGSKPVKIRFISHRRLNKQGTILLHYRISD